MKANCGVCDSFEEMCFHHVSTNFVGSDALRIFVNKCNNESLEIGRCEGATTKSWKAEDYANEHFGII